MKKVLLLVVAVCMSFVVHAQIDKRDSAYIAMSAEKKMVLLQERLDSLMEVNNELLNHTDSYGHIRSRYKLYKTDNIYNLLRLDTMTGKIKQVQWSLNPDNEFTMVINDEDFSRPGYTSGYFELYPTNNMYQFILMDTTNGRMWHVQWGTEEAKRWIRRIFSLEW